MRWLQTILPWVILLHTAAFLAFWLTNAAFYADTNNFLLEKLGMPLDYIHLCMVVTGLLALWSVANILLTRMPQAPVHGWHWLDVGLYAFLGLIYVVLFYGSFVVLFEESPVQKIRLLQLLNYYRLILDPLVLLVCAWLAGRWVGHNGAWARVVPPLLILLLLWVLALVFPPDAVYQGSLPAKPMLIAHRGASMLAPENTRAAMQYAVKLGAYGLETDVRISQDGQLFLMHDETLARTTNVDQIFPGREKDRAETFTRAELDQLSAGAPFVQNDPSGMIANGKVTGEQARSYLREGIPSFLDWLAIARAGGQYILFDLYPPTDDHPFLKALFLESFYQVLSAGLNDRVWFLANMEQANFIKKNAPQLKLAAGVDADHPASAGELLAQGYQVVNSEFSLPLEQVRHYQQAGLWVNLWTVDEPWQFSRLWLAGVNSITTNNLQEMVSLNTPALALPYSGYLIAWLIVGIISANILLWGILMGW